VRRQKMERLAALEAQEAHSKEQYAEYERDWQKQIANMLFDERMDYQLWEARMKLDNWMPDWVDVGEDDEET
jgi:hypothetical protein